MQNSGVNVYRTQTISATLNAKCIQTKCEWQWTKVWAVMFSEN